MHFSSPSVPGFDDSRLDTVTSPWLIGSKNGESSFSFLTTLRTVGVEVVKLSDKEDAERDRSLLECERVLLKPAIRSRTDE